MGLGGKKRLWVGEQGSRWAELQRGGSDLGGLFDACGMSERPMILLPLSSFAWPRLDC